MSFEEVTGTKLLQTAGDGSKLLQTAGNGREAAAGG